MRKTNELLRAITLAMTILLIFMTSSCSHETGRQKPVRVELMSSSWLFTSMPPARSTLSPQVTQAELIAPEDIEKGFAIRLNVDLKPFVGEETLLEIPQIVTVSLRQHDAQKRERQNYPAFRMPDGSVPVLEASVTLQLPVNRDEKQDLIVGIPLAMLDKPEGKHEVILNFSGVRWTMYVDGKLLDNEFALGYPRWTGKSAWKINPDYVGKAEIFMPALKPERLILPEPETVPEIQYWTPPGHNTWVGDVATLYHNGRYHVFYLYDRRHHASKFGRGAHYFEHLSTADFKTWIEHEAATPLEEQWETFGTGTPFALDGKLYVSYGLHTTRIYPKEETTLPEQWDYLEKNGVTGSFRFATTKGVPAGSTYSVSADGISSFQKTGVMFHPCENPSVYIDPAGKLKLLANYASKGTWESESVDGGWRCIDPEFPLGGDCTFYFRWGMFDYVIGGFVNFWSRLAAEPNAKYTDVVAQGLDFYNGLNVPAITVLPDGRCIMAGWMGIRGWGGPLIIHEMIQFPDGRIGTKWMDEITPLAGQPETLASKLTETASFPTEDQSFLLTFRVHPVRKGGKLGIVFRQDGSEQNACEWQICPDELRAQFSAGLSAGFASVEKSLREGGRPQNGRNYAIENLIGVDRPFTVRLIVKSSEKLGGSMIDAEIAGQRTMVAHRTDLFVKQMLFRTDGVELRDIRIAPLVNK